MRGRLTQNTRNCSTLQQTRFIHLNYIYQQVVKCAGGCLHRNANGWHFGCAASLLRMVVAVDIIFKMGAAARAEKCPPIKVHIIIYLTTIVACQKKKKTTKPHFLLRF